MTNGMRWTREQFESMLKKHGPAVISAAIKNAPKSQKRSKYGNKRTVVCGEQFDSGKEAQRYEQLLLLERAGQITQLRHHVRYPINVAGIDICEYEADFTYRDELGALHVEDVKSDATRTQLYKLKRRLMAAVHSINVEEIL